MDNIYIYFHAGDFIPRSTFTSFPCKHTEVYVTGLEENDVYLEDTHGLRIYRDEQVFLCTENTSFNVYSNADQTYLGNLAITWDTSCELKTEPYLSSKDVASPITTITTQRINSTKETTSTTIKEDNVVISTLSSYSFTSPKATTQFEEEIVHLPIGNNVTKEEAQLNHSILPYFIGIILVCLLLIVLLTKKGDNHEN